MRIAYVSHVDSRWIKQRPHFIAESMHQRGETVTYVCSGLVRNKLLVRSQTLSIPVLRIPMLPQRFRRRLRYLDLVLSAISAAVILVRLRPQAVVFTHSRHHWLARLLRVARVRIFYDCMDLNGLFADATSTDIQDERHLVNASNRVFCSSKPIAEHIHRMSSDVQVDLVPNALHQVSFLEAAGQERVFTPKTVGYVGAISSWFDFEAVLALLDARSDLTVHLWGPRDVAIPKHNRLKYLGILPHDAAVSAMRSCAVLILPFSVNDLILAVDPVKVYEYVATGRPVVTSDYPQLDHFGDRIYRYRSPKQLIALVGQLQDKSTLGREDLAEFIKTNNWMVRAEMMASRLA